MDFENVIGKTNAISQHAVWYFIYKLPFV